MSSVTFKKLNDSVALILDDDKPICTAKLETTKRWVVSLDKPNFTLGRGLPGSESLEELVKTIEHKYRRSTVTS